MTKTFVPCTCDRCHNPSSKGFYIGRLLHEEGNTCYFESLCEFCYKIHKSETQGQPEHEILTKLRNGFTCNIEVGN